MKFLTKNTVLHKMIIVLLIMLILIFAITPCYNRVYADDPDDGNSIGSTLLKEVVQLVVSLGDVVMGALNYFMLGTSNMWDVMISQANNNLKVDSGSWLVEGIDSDPDDQLVDHTTNGISIDAGFWPWNSNYEIPNMLYAPESIFSNRIAALDVNFIAPGTYTSVQDEDRANNAAKSAAETLKEVISSWYKSFRNIAIVGLLSVLVYLGIRILISSTSVDKAKYKESLNNWLVALCLVFVMHFIMSGILMIVNNVTELFSAGANDGIYIKVPADDAVNANAGDGRNILFKTNLIGYVRFESQASADFYAMGYGLVYVILVIYTVVFTFVYLKRFLYMAFFTMIAPLVALTYPIDKVGDGKAQAFNMWFKEYTMNAVIQPVHLILYTALVTSAIELAKDNVIYAVVAIAFLIPAEKFIKKMFGLDKAETPGGLGSFAAGAATMTGLKQLTSWVGGKDKKKGASSGNEGSSDSKANNKIRTQDRGLLSSYQGNEDNSETSGGIRETGNGITLGNNDGIDNGIGNNGIGNNGIGNGINNGNVNTNMLNGGVGRDISPSWTSNENHSGIILPSDYATREKMNKPNSSASTDTSTPTSKTNNVIPQAKLTPKNGWRRRLAITGAKKGAKMAYKGAKLATRALGAGAGAVVGLAAGASTGDFSKALTYMGAGALAGNQLGKVAANIPENIAKNDGNVISDKIENARYEIDKEKYGVEYAAQQSAIRQNERAKQRFMKDKTQREKYEEMAGRIKTNTEKNVSVDDLMAASFDYQKAGITDEKQIETGLTMEAKYGGVNGDKHDNMIDIVNMTKDYGKDYVMDDKKRNQIQDVIKTNVDGNKNQKEVWKFYTEALGMEKLGKKYGLK